MGLIEAAKQANEITVEQAVAEAEASAERLLSMARGINAGQCQPDTWSCRRQWCADAGTYVYHSHIAVSGQDRERLHWLSNVFFHAASLHCQPWYPQFKGGKRQVLASPPVGRVIDHQLCWGRFDLGLPSPRYYRQLLSLLRPADDAAVIVARSVDHGPALPAKARLAYTLSPNGEVLLWRDDQLHWHHICCTPGAGILNGSADRWLINALRWLRLDQSERRTYRCEAEQLRDWLHAGQPSVSPAILA